MYIDWDIYFQVLIPVFEQFPSGKFSITGLSSSHLSNIEKVNLTDSINSLIGKCSGTEYFAVHAWAHELVFYLIDIQKTL